MAITSSLSKKCCEIIQEYESLLNKELNSIYLSNLENSNQQKYSKLFRNKARIGSSLINNVSVSTSSFRKDSSLIWSSECNLGRRNVNNSTKTIDEDDTIIPDTCEKYLLIDSYTNVLTTNKPQACIISLLTTLPQNTIIGIKFGEHLCQGKINDTIIEYVSPALPVGRQYARLYLNGAKIGVKFKNGNIKSEIRDYLPFDVIIQETKLKKYTFLKNKTRIPVGVMGQNPLPEVDLEDEIEDLLILHKPRSNSSLISRQHALDKYFKGTHSKVVNAPRRETGDLNKLDPSYRAAINRDFIRRLSNSNLEPDCIRTINLLNEFISKFDIGIIGSVIPFHIKLEYWNNTISNNCKEIIDDYHTFIKQENSNEKSVYIFTKTSTESIDPYSIFMFSCILNEENDQIVPLLRRFSCMPNTCDDPRLWLCIGDCPLVKNETANQFRKIDLPCPIPFVMKSSKSSYIWNRKKSIINDKEKDKSIQISNNVHLFFEAWPSKLLPNTQINSELYSFTICIDKYKYHSVTGVSQAVLNFILQKWLTKVPMNLE